MTLPPLPEPHVRAYCGETDLFTAEQMHEYALRALDEEFPYTITDAGREMLKAVK